MEAIFKFKTYLKSYSYKILSKIVTKYFNEKYVGLYVYGRRVGNTTRLVDMFVQDFFKNGKCDVYDHYGTRESSMRVFNLVLQRLNMEHGICEKDLLLNRSSLAIKKQVKQKRHLVI